MGRSKHLISAFTITAAGAALLTGCSSDDPDTDAAGPVSSSPAAAASASSPAPAESRSATPYTEPAECAGLGLKSEATLAGKDLAACVRAAFAAYGTGTENLLVGDWKVDTEKALISLENGKDVQAWRVTNARDPDRTAGPRGRRTQQACSA
ncbi:MULTISPECIES: hypothetical protein [Streptomyces]|uniref:hypothetical protein n=1 Tax=Streptomyces TaxID=1883 RepID=UPI0033F253E4